MLPEAVLGRVERHALGVAAHREALLQRRTAPQARPAPVRAAGDRQDAHDPLPGRPDDGLHAADPDRTRTARDRLGRRARAGPAAGGRRARGRRSRRRGPELRARAPAPVLFDLLDAMDGAAADADLLFVLTTNRADLLEPALAARPGRVDVAIEIDLPDAEARAPPARALRPLDPLCAVRGRDTRGHRADGRGDRVVSQGAAAPGDARVASERSAPSRPSPPRTPSRALDDLLDSGQRLTRSLLGVGNDPETLPAGGGAGMLPPHPRPGRMYSSVTTIR